VGGFQGEFLLMVLGVKVDVCIAVVEEGRLDVAIGWREISGFTRRICELGNHERLQV
jgi:hypothetical protein